VFKEHVETLHGIVRPHHRSSGTISSPLGIFSSTAFVDPATSRRLRNNVVWLSHNLLEAYFTCESIFCGSPVDFSDGGPKLPLSRGLFGFVALRCYADKCAFSLSTQAQDHVWDLVEYKRVEPAHCPTGATSGGTGCERNIMRGIPPSFFMRAPCSLHDWVLELDLICVLRTQRSSPPHDPLAGAVPWP
jgi:hypothetical protein